MSVLRVVIVDDEAIIRRGLRLILEASEGIEVVGEAAEGAAGVALVRELRPDLALVDIRMPVMDGLEAIGPMVADNTRVLVLTTFDLDENVYRAFQAGASGFLLKTGHPDDLVHAVRMAARGDALLEPAVSRRLIERFASPSPQSPRPPWADRLTERERDVLLGMARGHSNAEIGRELFLSEATVKTHVSGVLSKLRVRDRLQAVVLAYESDWVRQQG